MSSIPSGSTREAAVDNFATPHTDKLHVMERYRQRDAGNLDVTVQVESAKGFFPNLDKYYQACVADGRGAFVIIVRSYRDFASAMRRKLILEISQSENPTRPAQEKSAQTNLLRHIAGAKPTPVQTPALLRPGRNEYSNHCDVADAPLANRPR